VPDTDLFKFDRGMRNTIRKRLAIEEGITLFSFIGYIGTYRGLENIVDAINILSKTETHFRFLLIGRGPLKHRIVKKMKRKGLSEYLLVKDFIPLTNVPHYLCASDVVFCLYDPVELNNWYAVPNKLFEAAACARPVIAGNFGYLKILILEMNCGVLADPTTPEDIAKQMRRLIRDPDLREKLGENGEKSIKRTFNLNNISKKLENILLEFV
jgi:glycosyltransferase involved in cell wall biosynthesis